MKILSNLQTTFFSQDSLYPGLPDVLITSVHRPDSSGYHARPGEAIDFIFKYKSPDNTDKKDHSLLKYLDRYWKGGLGANLGSLCKHFHLDIGTKRRWLETTDKKNFQETNSCSKSLKLLQWRNLGQINSNDIHFWKNEFSPENSVTFPDGTVKKQKDLIGNSSSLASPILPGLNLSGLSGMLPLLLLLFMRGKK